MQHRKTLESRLLLTEEKAVVEYGWPSTLGDVDVKVALYSSIAAGFVSEMGLL
jgi:hypothetical protein